MLNKLKNWWEQSVEAAKETLKTKETNLGINKKQIQVELPAPPPAGGFACCPSGDNEYDDAVYEWQKKCNTMILAAVPRGYDLKSSEVKEERIVRHYANLVVEKS